MEVGPSGPNMEMKLNINLNAVAKVKNPLPVPTTCNICGHGVRLATHQEVYGRDFSDWPYLYYCDDCGAYVGIHPFTDIPLGTLADLSTRSARKHCKEPFERIWRCGYMKRREAYAWLAEALNIPVEECHFGWFDVSRCYQARGLCQTKIKELASY